MGRHRLRGRLRQPASAWRRVSDLLGRKAAIIGGLAVFALASALGGAAPSFAVLVTARAVQGAAGAMLAPAALSTLVTTFEVPRDRARAFGVFATVAVAGGAVGLILGGVHHPVPVLALGDVRQRDLRCGCRGPARRLRPHLAARFRPASSPARGHRPHAHGRLHRRRRRRRRHRHVRRVPVTHLLLPSGMALGSGAMLCLTQITVGSGYASHVLPALMLMGLGMGLVMASSINTATAGVAPRTPTWRRPSSTRRHRSTSAVLRPRPPPRRQCSSSNGRQRTPPGLGRQPAPITLPRQLPVTPTDSRNR